MNARHPDVKVLALLSQKGGSGKSTLAIHLSVLAEAAGHSTILCDTDPQRSAASWWKLREAGTPRLVQGSANKVRDVIGAAREGGVELLVVDGRPSVERETADLAAVADLVLIPTRASILDILAIKATVDVVKAIGRPAAIVFNQVQPGRDGGEATVTAEARQSVAGYGLPMVPTAVTTRVALTHALIDGSAVSEFEPDGKAAGELRAVWEWVEGRL